MDFQCNKLAVVSVKSGIYSGKTFLCLQCKMEHNDILFWRSNSRYFQRGPMRKWFKNPTIQCGTRARAVNRSLQTRVAGSWRVVWTQISTSKDPNSRMIYKHWEIFNTLKLRGPPLIQLLLNRLWNMPSAAMANGNRTFKVMGLRNISRPAPD